MTLRSVVALGASMALFVMLACAGGDTGARSANARRTVPLLEGTVDVDGLVAPVTVIRDRSGIPHIFAGNVPDLFFAQGFVQAQDRLFQMDLWRRAALGRLSEVLGANFIQRDAMTRRVQYRGDLDVEWRAYGSDTRDIVTAFTRGVNAWIDGGRSVWPDEFRLAGWTPEHWAADDLLNRTDAFAMSVGGQDEVFRARLSAAIGVDRVNAMLPLGGPVPAAVPGVDLSAITSILGEAIGRAGAPPFFAGFAAPFAGGSNAWAMGGARTVSGQPLLAVDPHRRFDAPSLRYLIHLNAPGWNVAGAAAPWLPGVVFGHNEQMSWGMATAPVDVQDIYVEQLNPANPTQVREGTGWVDMTIALDEFPVKGRAEPFTFERQYTKHGPVIGLDRGRHLAYVLRWSGMEAGAAAELGALALDRAQSVGEFVAALARWKMPASDVVFAERDGTVGRRRVALVPRRVGFSGALPVDGWSGARAWRGWLPVVSGSDAVSTDALVVAANDDPLRENRLRAVLLNERSVDVDRLAAVQRDTVSQEALALIPLLRTLNSGDPLIADARHRLLAWDRRMGAGSADARLFSAWKQQMMRALAERAAPPQFRDELAARMPLAAIVTAPSRAWFGRDSRRAAETFPAETLRVAAERTASNSDGAWAAAHTVTFRHPLALSAEAKARFNVGPFGVDGDPHTVQAISSGGTVGPGFRAVFDSADWDRSLVVNAPGQSGWPGSPYYANMAGLWDTGQMTRLLFSEGAVRGAAQHTLTLRPRPF